MSSSSSSPGSSSGASSSAFSASSVASPWEAMSVTITPDSAQHQRPCEIYYEIAFPSSAADLFCIQFRNYYSTWLTVKQREHDDTRWRTVLKRHRLMEDAHYEDDAQDWHSIKVSEFSPRYSPFTVAALRLYLVQPSSCWLKVELRQITCYQRRKETSPKADRRGNRRAQSTSSSPGRGDELGLQPALFQLDRLTRDIGQQIFTFRDHSLASERHHLYNY